MMGLDPKQMAAMQEVSKFIKGAIRVNYNDNTMLVAFTSEMPNAAALIPNLLDQFSNALATQLSSFFEIKGEITEIGKK